MLADYKSGRIIFLLKEIIWQKLMFLNITALFWGRMAAGAFSELQCE